MIEKCRRNNRIAELYNSGSSCSEIAREYGIGTKRVRQIVIKEKESQKKRATPLYKALSAACEELEVSKSIVNRIYNKLERYHRYKQFVSDYRIFEAIAADLEHPEFCLRDFQDLGVKSEAVILRAIEIAKERTWL